MKKNYVLCFAHRIPHCNTEDVILILREKDDWQRGLLNLPGGHIYEGEPVEKAAARELMEETGIWSNVADIKELGQIEGEKFLVHVCFCPYHEWFRGAEQKPNTTSTEGKIIVLPWRDTMNAANLIPNLKIIIPYCQARLLNWKLIPVGTPESSWVTTFHAPVSQN
jgi:ADP-ribose pyrophosphatase YjhB (NUDIX family)